MKKIKVEENQFILKIGEASDCAYVILKGQVGVFFSLTYENEGAKPDITLAENEVFGEIGIINDSLRSASIKSMTPVELLKIEKNEMKKMINQSPPFIQGLIRTLSHRLSNTNFVARKSKK